MGLQDQAVVSIRPIKRVVQAQPSIEGAGGRLRRAFGFGKTSDLFQQQSGVATLTLAGIASERRRQGLSRVQSLSRCGSDAITGLDSIREKTIAKTTTTTKLPTTI